MKLPLSLQLYEGAGKTIQDRNLRVPPFYQNPEEQKPGNYRASQGLTDAVNIALALGLPLLITGEPGTGKTQLAYSVAWELGLGQPEVFYTKSVSAYTDLFYQYDALRHYRDIQFEAVSHKQGRELPVLSIDSYITFGPLGRAIILAMDESAANFPKDFRGQTQRRSVVLIDEIDKAPRDFPNDILNEIDRMMFEIRELPFESRTFQADASFRPILIMTSNAERDLPEAFRRRCVFYHIEFDQLNLTEIIKQNLPDLSLGDEAIENALKHFKDIRSHYQLAKKPATAELLVWIDLLTKLRLDVKDPQTLSREDRFILAATYSLLAKSDEDLRMLQEPLTKNDVEP